MINSVEANADPTFTHFSHKEDFFRLLHKLLGYNLEIETSDLDNEKEEKHVEQLGAMVDCFCLVTIGD